jgi:hypothetical protein
MGKMTNYSPTFPMFPGSAGTITPSDSANLPTPSVVYVGTGGNVAVTTPQGDQVTFVNLPAGSVIPVQVLQVRATGTTATNLVRIY